MFKAGIVGTLADKTAYGYVMKFYDKQGIRINKYEADRLTTHCTGVKRTTGQHPGRVIVRMTTRYTSSVRCNTRRPTMSSPDIITTTSIIIR